MALESTRAVLLLEVRSRPSDPEDAVERSLSRARAVLEAPTNGREWTPAAGSGVSGTLALEDAAEVFPVLHRLRTELRAEPDWPRVDVVAGLGRGDAVEGGRLAAEAFRNLGKRGRFRTRALTRDADANTVLGALCRTLDSLHVGWTRAQWQAVHRRDGGRTLQEIGGELGIAYQNVSKRLIAAQYSLYRDVLDAASLVFSRASVIRD